MSYAEFAGGLLLALVTLWDAFETLVLPRTVQRRFRLTRFIVRASWFPLTWLTRLPLVRRSSDTLLAWYGPMLLFLLLGTWAVSLIIAFGLLLHAIHTWDHSALRNADGLATCIYYSGSTFFTLGLGDVTPLHAGARLLAVIEAGTGFGFLAIVIGYLPIFYTAFSRREVAISLLDARAGSPPTAVELVRRNGARVAEELLLQWEAWTSELLESHLSYPILAYFRSQHDHQSWLAALTVILDTSALIMSGLEGMSNGQARFSFAIARHALVDLAQIFFTSPQPPQPDRLSHADFVELRDRLASYGHALQSNDNAEQRLTELRRSYEPIAYALSSRLLIALPPWLPAPGAQDDWQSSPWDTLPPI